MISRSNCANAIDLLGLDADQQAAQRRAPAPRCASSELKSWFSPSSVDFRV
jgi:hypothetical protein